MFLFILAPDWLSIHQTLAFSVTLFFLLLFLSESSQTFPLLCEDNMDKVTKSVFQTPQNVEISTALAAGSGSLWGEWEQIDCNVLKNKTQSRIYCDFRSPGSATSNQCLQHLYPSAPPGPSNKKNPSKPCSVHQVFCWSKWTFLSSDFSLILNKSPPMRKSWQLSASAHL